MTQQQYSLLQFELRKLMHDVLSAHLDEWRLYCLEWVDARMQTINAGGDRVLDPGEDPELPARLLEEINEEWPVDNALVEEVIAAIAQCVADARLMEIERGESGHVDRQFKFFVNYEQGLCRELRYVEKDAVHYLLEGLYSTAVDETWIERLTKTNYKDVERFQRHLNKVIYNNVHEMVEWHLVKTIRATLTRLTEW